MLLIQTNLHCVYLYIFNISYDSSPLSPHVIWVMAHWTHEGEEIDLVPFSIGDGNLLVWKW